MEEDDSFLEQRQQQQRGEVASTAPIASFRKIIQLGLGLLLFFALVLFVAGWTNPPPPIAFEEDDVYLMENLSQTTSGGDDGEPVGDDDISLLGGSAEEQEEGELSNYNEDVGNCTAAAFVGLERGSYALAEKEANCGSGYYPLQTTGDAQSTKRPYRIHLLGETLGKTYRLTGCVVGSHCPLHPQCSFSWGISMFSKELHEADMIIVTNFEGVAMMERAVHRTKKQRKVKRVLQWREAYWPYISPNDQRNAFDLTMGVFMQSDLISPFYLRRPHTMLYPRQTYQFLPFEQRTEFAMSIISNCDTNSKRKIYINHLKDYLGAERIHQYGDCGDRKLPPPPINRARKVIARYKFYLSFENTLSTGYMSEKIFTVMNMNLVPVYMGGRDMVVNITTTPSYINVFDFASPQKLAEYLLFLDGNPKEYAKYHEWRTAKEPFTREYLDLVKNKFPGQAELRLYGHENMGNRRAVCCRLCNEAYVDGLVANRGRQIDKLLSEQEINKRLFAGTMHQRPGAGKMLAPPKEPAAPLVFGDED